MLPRCYCCFRMFFERRTAEERGIEIVETRKKKKKTHTHNSSHGFTVSHEGRATRYTFRAREEHTHTHTHTHTRTRTTAIATRTRATAAAAAARTKVSNTHVEHTHTHTFEVMYASYIYTAVQQQQHTAPKQIQYKNNKKKRTCNYYFTHSKVPPLHLLYCYFFKHKSVLILVLFLHFSLLDHFPSEAIDL